MLRHTRSGPLPGQALVVLDPRRKLMLDVIPCEDAYAQERSPVPQLLERVKPGKVFEQPIRVWDPLSGNWIDVRRAKLELDELTRDGETEILLSRAVCVTGHGMEVALPPEKWAHLRRCLRPDLRGCSVAWQHG